MFGKYQGLNSLTSFLYAFRCSGQRPSVDTQRAFSGNREVSIFRQSLSQADSVLIVIPDSVSVLLRPKSGQLRVGGSGGASVQVSGGGWPAPAPTKQAHGGYLSVCSLRGLTSEETQLQLRGWVIRGRNHIWNEQERRIESKCWLQ